MDSMEINKIVAGVVGALLVYLGVHYISTEVFHLAHHGGDKEHHYAYAIEIEEEEDEGEEETIDVAALMAAADLAKGEKAFSKCKACHKVDDGANGVGPHLYGVVGRDIAAVDGYSYSGALNEAPGDWTAEELFAFLTKPKAYAPGTKMAFAGFKKPEDSANVIAWLDSLDD